MATQQGFAGITTVDRGTTETHWLRQVNFQPPAEFPDAGHASFETGIHADYLEHWPLVPGSDDGFSAFRCLDDGPPTFLLTAGALVMYVRSRSLAFDAQQWARGEALRQQLDVEISFGERNAAGWQILHSTLPWREGAQVALTLGERDDGSVQRDMNGIPSRWEVLEWTPPRVR